MSLEAREVYLNIVAPARWIAEEINCSKPRLHLVFHQARPALQELFRRYVNSQSGGQHRSRLYILGFSVLTVIIVYVMLDVGYSHAGLIHLESADQMLVNLRANMK